MQGFNPLLLCIWNPSHAHESGTQIKAPNQRLDIFKERTAALNFINLRFYEDKSNKVHASRLGNRSREMSGEFDQSGVVGDQIK
jgi:hypothetical protein